MIAAAWASLAATTCAALGQGCNRFLFGWLPDDPPHAGRKQHARPMPLAGILLLPAIVPWLLAELAWWPLLAATLAAGVGFVDDWQKERGPGLDWRWKTLVLALAAIAAAMSVVSPRTEPQQFAIVVLFAFVLTNAVNFLDNTDGVAASLAAASLLLLSRGDDWIAAAGFAALGFLPWNWPRPRLFLGDAGAYTLGMLLAIAAASAWRNEPGALWAVAVPLLDFTQVVVARLWLGVAPWIGDRRHLTHIVRNLGVPGWAIAPLFAAIAVLLAQLR